MGATVFIVLLAGLAFPIVLILCAVLVDLVALFWAAFRIGNDELMPWAVGYLDLHFTRPLVRYVKAHGVILGQR
jgi:hypothetical protein